MKRRKFLKSSFAVSVASLAVSSGLLSPSWASIDEKDPFKAASVEDVLKILGASDAKTSDQIKIKAPEIAENGAVVPIGITSKIEGTTEIMLITAENPTPLSAMFTVGEGADATVKSRFKMGKTTDVITLVKAGDKFYTAKANVKVTKGGCGG